MRRRGELECGDRRVAVLYALHDLPDEGAPPSRWGGAFLFDAELDDVPVGPARLHMEDGRSAPVIVGPVATDGTGVLVGAIAPSGREADPGPLDDPAEHEALAGEHERRALAHELRADDLAASGREDAAIPEWERAAAERSLGQEERDLAERARAGLEG